MKGHNSAAFGEELCEEVESILVDGTKKLFHYVQWHLTDYIAGTQGMSAEQEGVYMRFLVRLYDRGKPFPDDDKFMALMMSLDIRRWRRIKKELIGTGKIVIRSESLTNTRFEKERVKRAHELQKQADATRKYWEQKRKKEATSAELAPNFDATSDELSGEVHANDPKKSNKINGSGKHPTSYTRETRDQRLESIKKENNNHPSLETAREAGVDEVQGLNGATSHIVKTLGEWLNPMMPDHKTARGWLESSVGMYGGAVVRDSFAELEAKIMQGDIIARPIPLLTKICQRRKADGLKTKPDPMAKIFSGVL